MSDTEYIIIIICVAVLILIGLFTYAFIWDRTHKEELEKKREARLLARKEKEAKTDPQGHIAGKVFAILFALILVCIMAFVTLKIDLHYLGRLP